ncbi:hypothetical protein KUV51_00970 [Tateyamaria omphalii]|uniref:hypothetical protein n=1 Tax=Tateyamaria omphalii TaxID=299262 RepID=UPI001C992F32|nr:hypothetical protein [Tateyamaria omphalii]MBY5931553.1 hypothetical protein [Tateyamaria omphalii]
MLALLALPANALDIQKSSQIGDWQVIVAQTANDGLSCQALLNASNGSLLLWGSQDRNSITPLVGLGSGYPKGSRAVVNIAGQNFEFHQPKAAGANRFSPIAKADDAKIVRSLASNRNAKVIGKGKGGQFTLRTKRMKQVLSFFNSNCGISLR